MSTAEDPGAGRSRRPRRPSGDDRERALLATAERLLEERPLAEISVDDLARGAGISRSTFYFYFASKEAVVLALLDRVVAEARAARAEALSGTAGARAAWRAALVTVRDTFRDHRALTAAATELLAASPEVRGLWSAVMDDFVAETAAAIEAERARGAAPPGPPARDLAVALNWMNERVIQVSVSGHGPGLAADDLLDVLLTVWLRTIYGSDADPDEPRNLPADTSLK
ncbi:TetR/AcrR family transcriptional regulator [Blastococcus sp. TF02A-26]|uniref:TetR/AcrR family transcriptional regulator n=1 Tax=Blastococcus sp. TF02A-26 TaxID=2250577 RepID=UPI000DE838FD|nr:TetR/AcrR family transcriptional regulator [Blastococcus sp. TF02A-26]RBY90759.1 TetR/AcrR family transcriptional regulator [Blastococcus sp. TF02A-26]